MGVFVLVVSEGMRRYAFYCGEWGGAMKHWGGGGGWGEEGRETIFCIIWEVL